MPVPRPERESLATEGNRVAQQLHAGGHPQAAAVVRRMADTLRETEPPQDTNAYVGTQTAAHLLGVSDARVRQLYRAGQLRVVRETDRRMNIPLADIDRLLAQRAATNTSCPSPTGVRPNDT